jgi:hypothetical protein
MSLITSNAVKLSTLMKPTIKLSQQGPGIAQIGKALADLSKMQVYVGIPESEAARPKKKGETINNAQLMYIHTNGSPLKGIPARPVIEPSIEAPDNKASIAALLKQAAQSALAGKRTDVLKFLRLAGMDAQNRVRAWFVDPRNHWAPNAPSTIARKHSDKPLIDTAELRKSVSYVVDEGR